MWGFTFFLILLNIGAHGLPLGQSARNELTKKESKTVSIPASATVKIAYDSSKIDDPSYFRVGISAESFAAKNLIHHKTLSKSINESDMNFSPLTGVFVEYDLLSWNSLTLGGRGHVQYTFGRQRISTTKLYDELRSQYYQYSVGLYSHYKLGSWPFHFQVSFHLGEEINTLSSGSNSLNQLSERQLQQVRYGLAWRLNNTFRLTSEVYRDQGQTNTNFSVSVSAL